MKFLRKTHKAVALFFLINFGVQIFAPTVSYALTSGPTAPEFSSFEPVDTTDMVNLATGEFVYNSPLIDIPGPEGGYPLSLSYHAGIKLDQEASWVGLGFTLNPGAINRTVDGFADDNSGSKREVRDYWGGGSQTTRTYSVGLSVPNTGIGINYSLGRTTDTYKGFSSNGTLGISFAPSIRQPKVAAFGQIQSLFSADILQNATLGIRISSKGYGISIGNQSLNGNTTNNLSGNITSFTNETGVFGIGFFKIGSLEVKDFYTRYWSDETQSLTNYGTLYPGLANAKIGQDFYETGIDSKFNAHTFDVYDIYDGSSEDIAVEENEVDDDDFAKQIGGTLPAYDRFDVLGQGIGGVMQPCIFENGDLYGQSIYERNPFTGQPAKALPILAYKSLKPFSNKKVDFRFLNDFSNSLTIEPSTIKENGDELYVDPHIVKAMGEGFNNSGSNQKLAGSKHIEWFSNEEITIGAAKQKGFIDFYQSNEKRKLDFEIYENYLQPEACVPYSGLVTYGKGQGAFLTKQYNDTDLYKDLPRPQFRSLKPKLVDLRKKIGGFMITNESGVTYHYALPVYSYNEYTRSSLKNPAKGTPTFREYKNDEPYAYSWLLTGITGPDYIDRNTNGVLDENDFGYWVKFDYGRWADSFQWRTPHSADMTDVESEYQTFSYGVKELYYLDAVETRSHKAIFIKSKRKDGKGVTSRLEGGSNPRRFEMNYKSSAKDAPFGRMVFSVSPVSTMKLDAVYLFDKKTLSTIQVSKSKGEKYREATTTKPFLFRYMGDDYTYDIPFSKINEKITVKNGEDFIKVKYHNGDLVYDDDDIRDLPQFKSKALRTVQFDTDYSLSKDVPNSFGYFSDLQKTNPLLSCWNPSLNPCTTSLATDFDFEWPSNRIPPRCCDYTSAIDGSISGHSSNKLAFYSMSPFGEFFSPIVSNYDGNEITYFRTGKLTLKSLKFLGKAGSDLMPPTVFAYGENPSYTSQKYDDWGYYKSDFDPSIDGHTRKITLSSAASVDSWSLRSIESPLGSKTDVEYEPQTYETSVYNGFSTFSIGAIARESGVNQLRVLIKEKNVDLNKWFTVNGKIDAKALFVYNLWRFSESGSHKTLPELYVGNNTSDIVNAIGSDYLIITSPVLSELANRTMYIETIPYNGNQITYNAVPYFIAGFIKVADEVADRFSGGVRVKSLTVTSNNTEEQKTEFSYVDPSSNVSSGVTAFKPYIMPSIHYPKDIAFFDNINDNYPEDKKLLDKYRNSYQRLVSETFQDIRIFNHETPSPGSIYEYVTVKNRSKNVLHDNYSIHHFKVFNRDMISRDIVGYSTANISRRNVTIKNNASDIGSIISVVTYNLTGQPVKTMNYGYLYDEKTDDYEKTIQNLNQGAANQSFHKFVTINEYKVKTSSNSSIAVLLGSSNVNVSVNTLYSKEKAVVTKRVDRSNALTLVEEIDHKKGTLTRKENHSFDFYTGQVVKELNSDSYENKRLNEIIPAYKLKDVGGQNIYPGMGLKIYNPLNKHMLTQAAANYEYQLGADSKPIGLFSASIQTWSDNIPVLGLTNPQSGIWRKQSSFIWNGQQPISNSNGTYPITEWLDGSGIIVIPFDWSLNNTNNNWQKTSDLTLYDPYSHILEAADINRNSSSNRMDPEQVRVIASTANAAYNETAYSGAEFSAGNAFDEGDVNRRDGNPSIAKAHTGKYSLLVNSNGKGFSYTLKSGKVDLTKKYRASVWLYTPNDGETQSELNKMQLYYSINGVEKEVHPTLQKSKSKSWYLVNLDIIPNGNSDIVVGVRNSSVKGVYFDDFRVHPIDASMTAYVYDPFSWEVTHMLDGNNLYTHYEYDAMGRLVRSSREQLNFDFGDGKESFKADKITGEVIYNYSKKN